MTTEEHPILWQPSDDFIQNSNLKDYELWLGRNKQLYFDNYEALWQWSVSQVADFWESLWEYFDIIHHSPYQEVMSNDSMPDVKWFEGATLNYAEHIFRQKNRERPALVFQNESLGATISWTELESKVLAMQQFLRSEGIQKGDRVAAYLPNIPEAIISFLAVNSLGAVWSCCSPDFGVETVIERFSQIEPKLLITADGYRYNNKAHNRLDAVRQIRAQITSIQNTIAVPYLNSSIFLEDAIQWQDISTAPSIDGTLTFEAVPFDHPIWVLYSSGTTGRPKAITHSHGGVLLEHLKYMAFHNNVKPGENFFWFTTTGWMMWNFLQASFLLGATPVLYDGSPGYPSINMLWELAEALPIHHFGTSAPFLTACMKRDLDLKNKFDLSHLISIGSTGAPLPPEAFQWIYEKVSDKVWLCSMSGGTDVCTAFVGGNPYQVVQKGLIQSRALGCALYAYNEQGEKIDNQLGEMIIEQAMPSMPIYFWNDEGKHRYRSSYFEDYTDKWRHGDWLKIFDSGALIIQGRSDATLNRKGVRIGTAEIYNVLEKMEILKDSLIINIEKESGGDIMPLFVVLQENENLTTEVENQIKQLLKDKCSPRHVPDKIIAVPAIPYTLSGKKMEVPVKKAFMRMDIHKSMNRDAIRNPEAMDHFISLANTLHF